MKAMNILRRKPETLVTHQELTAWRRRLYPKYSLACLESAPCQARSQPLQNLYCSYKAKQDKHIGFKSNYNKLLSKSKTFLLSIICSGR